MPIPERNLADLAARLTPLPEPGCELRSGSLSSTRAPPPARLRWICRNPTATRAWPDRLRARRLRLLDEGAGGALHDGRRRPRELQRRQLHARLPLARGGRGRRTTSPRSSQSGWINEAALQALPHVRAKPACVVYGPLAQLPVAPDVVLLRDRRRRADDAAKRASRAANRGQAAVSHHRHRQGAGRAAASVGCALSRARTGMKPEEMTCALPGRCARRDGREDRGRGPSRPGDDALRERRRQALHFLSSHR